MLPHPFLLFAVQLVVIALVCRLVSRLTRPLMQPPVVGEMLAGILLGPSLLGAVAPTLSAALFPPDSMPALVWAGRVGLVVHMLGVGLSTRAEVARSELRSAASISLAGLAAPFLLGGLLAWRLHGGETPLFGAGVGRLAAALYLGAAMSITAFPVLARILEDRGLAGTPLGALVLSAGALDDLAAWAVVCGLVWTFKAEATLAVTAAFVAGLFLPKDGPVDRARRAVDPVSSLLALPVYFATSGLNTKIGLLSDARGWGVFALVLAAAVAGKGGACWLAAKADGRSGPEAMAIGSLMNARGLMELVILNMGLEHGLITPLLFTMMALMAVVTTFLAAPLYEWSRRLSPASAAGNPEPSGSRT